MENAHSKINIQRKRMGKDSPISEYLEWFKKTIGTDVSQEPYETSAGSFPFLSIIVITEGIIPEALAEALLCLTAQVCTDFEVLVIGHKLSDDQEKTVLKIIEDLPKWIRAKTRLVKTDRGNRAMSLHVGYAMAGGEYIVTYDDANTVMANWVETFKMLSELHPGTVLHAYSVSQEWIIIPTKGDRGILKAVASPDSQYCEDFDLLPQLTLNKCPPVSYAIPRYAYHDFGIVFDTTLTAYEDWDLLMRTAFVCGVSDSENVTSICRQISSGVPDSDNVHDREVLEKDYYSVTNKFSECPIVFPATEIQKLIRERLCQAKALVTSESPKLYYDTGSGFCEANTAVGREEAICKWVFESFSEEYLTSVRVDPCEFGPGTIMDFRLEIQLSTGETLTPTIGELSTNGVVRGDSFVFLLDDPMIIYELETSGHVDRVRVSYSNCAFNTTVLQELDALLKGDTRSQSGSFAQRLISRVMRLFKK